MRRWWSGVLAAVLVVGGGEVAGVEGAERVGGGGLDRAGVQWGPFVEWELGNASYEGNPFDVEGRVTFVHGESGERRTTGMFYDGEERWKFRFTGTRPGKWTFSTSSADPELDGRRGVVTVEANARGYGFVTRAGNKWARPAGVAGELEAFVPQYVMYTTPDRFHNRPERVDEHIRAALVEHGFSGFHVPVLCRWFDLEEAAASGIEDDDPNPDPRTFEALEMLITKTHRAGGVVHLWAWGDEQRRQTPVKWGINGKADRRLQRYIAARLGPLPGWTMGYGFDLWEWVKGEQLAEWHRHMHAHFGWPHMLGARASTNELNQLTEALDYLSYEQHRPDYAMYVKTIERRPEKPSFSEDRFRIRKSPYPEKDYDVERTRRGLWHSAMAGGVANIWGYLLGEAAANAESGPALPYPNREAIGTYAEFFRKRFLVDLERDNELTDGVCLRDRRGTQFLFYKEDAESVRLDLSRMRGRQPAVAVDAKKAYREIELGELEPKAQTWKAPYASDWGIAVGVFAGRKGERAAVEPVLSVKGDRFFLDGEAFDMWGVRVASAAKDEAQTEHLIAQLDEYKRHGVNTVTVFYQGSSGGNHDPFSADGRSIDAGHQARMEQIIRAAGERGMVVVVGIFYQHAPFGLKDAGAVGNAVRTVTEKLRPYRNIIINVANEQNSYGWGDTAAIFDFREPERIIELCRVVHEVDAKRLVGGGGYDHEKNILIGRSEEVDVLLFDTGGPPPGSGELYERFVAAGVKDKPIVNVELFGGWTNDYEKGVFPEKLTKAYLAEVEAAAVRPGLSVFFHNTVWMQREPLRYDLGGSGTKEDPGIRWYFEAVKGHAGGGG